MFFNLIAKQRKKRDYNWRERGRRIRIMQSTKNELRVTLTERITLIN